MTFLSLKLFSLSIKIVELPSLGIYSDNCRSFDTFSLAAMNSVIYITELCLLLLGVGGKKEFHYKSDDFDLVHYTLM